MTTPADEDQKAEEERVEGLFEGVNCGLEGCRAVVLAKTSAEALAIADADADSDGRTAKSARRAVCVAQRPSETATKADSGAEANSHWGEDIGGFPDLASGSHHRTWEAGEIGLLRHRDCCGATPG